jgi:hypothetical protein
LFQLDRVPFSCGGASDAPQLCCAGAPPPFHWQKDFMALHGKIKISSVAFSQQCPLFSFLAFPFWSSLFCFCPVVDFFQPYRNNCSYLPKKDWPISSHSQ